MSNTGLSVFDETIQLTNIWLNDIMARLDWDDRHRAYRALRATLHALRDRLPPNEASQLAAQLPMLVRGFYYEGWRPAVTPSKDRTIADFVSHVEEAFSRDPDENPERVVRAVLDVLRDKISEGEIEDIIKVMPENIRTLWRG